MKRQIALVKAQGVGDGVIVSTMELEALLAVVAAVKEWRTIPAGTVHEPEVTAAMLRIFDAMDALETVDKREQTP